MKSHLETIREMQVTLSALRSQSVNGKLSLNLSKTFAVEKQRKEIEGYLLACKKHLEFLEHLTDKGSVNAFMSIKEEIADLEATIKESDEE